MKNLENKNRLKTLLWWGKPTAVGLFVSTTLTIISIFLPIAYIWTSVLIAFVTLFGGVFIALFIRIIDVKGEVSLESPITEGAMTWFVF